MESTKSTILSLLKERGAHLDERSENGVTPLMDAIGYGHKEIFATLLRLGADVGVRDSFGRTPMMIAVEYGDIYFVNKLWACAKVHDEVDNNGEDLLVKCLFRRNTNEGMKIIEVLFDKGIEPKRLNKGMTLLHLAASNGKYQFISLLVDRLGQVNNRDDRGNTAATWAVSSQVELDSNTRINCIQELAQRGADVNIADNEGITPLLWAIQLGYYSLVKALIDYKADIRKTDIRGYEPIHYLVAKQRIKSNELDLYLKYFMDAGADINASRGDVEMPLIMAAREVVSDGTKGFKGDMLVKYGADIDKAIIFGKVNGESEELIHYLRRLKEKYDYTSNRLH